MRLPENAHLLRYGSAVFTASGRSIMVKNMDFKDLDRKIKVIKEAAEGLKEAGDRFPALASNSSRILASLKMLEINISDIVDATE